MGDRFFLPTPREHCQPPTPAGWRLSILRLMSPPGPLSQLFSRRSSRNQEPGKPGTIPPFRHIYGSTHAPGPRHSPSPSPPPSPWGRPPAAVLLGPPPPQGPRGRAVLQHREQGLRRGDRRRASWSTAPRLSHLRVIARPPSAMTSGLPKQQARDSLGRASAWAGTSCKYIGIRVQQDQLQIRLTPGGTCWGDRKITCVVAGKQVGGRDQRRLRVVLR